ncbi:ATP-binding cassette domain-containing protein [Nocardia transvalensis]|uniref:ATP-binding cassette domain-containing protein n=1 Tax=Nocardia transvalensis TaxID=37333 RepID=UPI00189442FB|nr:ATP-binding cassette domain-containing protein [Nocardia transvalensis]MBF6332812.1 ATP-binding cassette domain-containing protein [Nocardia transvalensis]
MAIQAIGLRKSFGEHTVLDGIDLNVAPGTVFSLLGPNGSGKTTTVEILTTLIPADGGDVWVGGHSVADQGEAVRATIGVTGQFSAVDRWLTGEENLLLMGDLNHLSRSESRRRTSELLERFDLVDAAKKVSRTYSGGMKRRLDLAMSLMGRPSIIFLDEPTTGLDPRSRRTLWQIIRELVADGVTIFLTTQYLEEADQLADYVAVLDQGKLVAQGTPAELEQRVPGGHISLQFPDGDALERGARTLGATSSNGEELTLQIASDGSAAAVKQVLDELSDHAVPVDRVSVHTPDLDDVFFALTGHAQSRNEKVGSS